MFQNRPLRRDKTAFVLITKVSWLPILDRYWLHPVIFCPTIEVREKIELQYSFVSVYFWLYQGSLSSYFSTIKCFLSKDQADVGLRKRNSFFWTEVQKCTGGAAFVL